MRLLMVVLGMLLLAGCDTRSHWQERIPLGDGGTVSVRRDVVIGPDAFFRKGMGGLSRTKLTISTAHGDVVSPERLPGLKSKLRDGPLILDFVGDDPVLVYPVSGGYCEIFGHALEGLIALRYQGSAWRRVPVSTLPPSFKTNIEPYATSSAARVHKVISLAELIAKQQSEEDSCANSAVAQRQAKNAQALQLAYRGTGSTLQLPAASPVTSLVAPSWADEEVRAGCGDLEIVEPTLAHVRFRFDPRPGAFVEVPTCDGYCAHWDRAIACTPEVLGMATLVYWPDEKRVRLVVARFARDGRLLRSDSLALSGTGWSTQPNFTLSPTPQVELWHKLPNRGVPDAIYRIALPPIESSTAQ